jgi:hypothetical protein
MSNKTSVLAAVLLIAGCQSHNTCCTKPMPASAPAAAAPAGQSANPAAAAAPASPAIVRIKAGSSTPFTDSKGNVWAADQGFVGGESADRSSVAVSNTSDPGLFRTERYGMTAFSWPLADGKYLVNLYFAETYEGVDGPHQRVFTVNVQGHQFKDFDVWVKAGGRAKAYVLSVPVEITNHKLMVTFNDQIENQEINAIEIIPQP